MTGLPQTGVELVVKGRDAFLGAMGNASKSVNAFTQTTKSAEKGVSVFGDVLKGTIAANVVMGGFSAITNGITNLGNQAFNAATQMQELTVSLESLAAREILGAGGANNMTEALDKAGPVAQNLLERIKELSIASPFEYKDVVNVFRLNMAFGQTSETSLALTKAITNMAAASGQGAGVMERIAYNFSQMSLTGRITARDIRDLALAGVDVTRVMREELGMSVEEVDAKLKSGQMTFQEVSNAFVSYADKNFGGAAERMSKTFKGLQSSFADLVTSSGLDLFGPALDRITTALQGLFSTAQQFVASGALKDLGTIFGEIVGLFISQTPPAVDEVTAGMMQIRDAIAETTPEAAKALEEIASENQQMEMRTKFQNLAADALEWGANIVTSLAEGIIMGASAVLSALLSIGNTIAEWLQPGSPPKILPDLPDWGAKAMNEYLKGFSSADFGYLNAVTSPIESALSMMGKGDLIPAFKMELAKTFSKGALDPTFAKSIIDQTGEFGGELVKLTQQQLQLAGATEQVAAAEKAVTDAQKKEITAYGKVRSEIDEYNRLLRGGASDEVLKAQKKNIDQGVKEYNTAKKKRTEAENNLGVAKETLAIMQEQVATQKQLVAEMLEYAKAVLAAQEKEAQEKEKKAAGGGGGDQKVKLPSVGGFPQPGDEDDPFAGISDAFKARVESIFEQMKTDIQAAWDNSAIVTKWNELLGSFNFDNLLTPEQQGMIAKIIGFLLLTGLAFVAVTGAAKLLAPAITPLFSPLGILTVAVLALGIALYFGQGGVAAFSGGVNVLVPAAAEAFSKAVVNMIKIAQKLYEKITGAFTKVLEKIDEWLTNIRDNTFPAIVTQFRNLASDSVDALLNNVPNFKSTGSDIVMGLVDGVIGSTQAFIDAVVDLAKQAIAAMVEALDSHSPSKVFAKIGESIPQGVREGVTRESQYSQAPTRPQYIQAAAQSSMRSSTVNMGGVTINDRMDAATFEAYITQVVSNALGA